MAIVDNSELEIKCILLVVRETQVTAGGALYGSLDDLLTIMDAKSTLFFMVMVGNAMCFLAKTLLAMPQV